MRGVKASYWIDEYRRHGSFVCSQTWYPERMCVRILSGIENRFQAVLSQTNPSIALRT